MSDSDHSRRLEAARATARAKDERDRALAKLEQSERRAREAWLDTALKEHAPGWGVHVPPAEVRELFGALGIEVEYGADYAPTNTDAALGELVRRVPGLRGFKRENERSDGVQRIADMTSEEVVAALTEEMKPDRID